MWGHSLKWVLTEDHKLGFLGKVFSHLSGLDLYWCDFISVLKTRAEKRELLLRNGPADLSISDLGKNCDNVTQYSTYFRDEEDQEVGRLDMTLMCETPNSAALGEYSLQEDHENSYFYRSQGAKTHVLSDSRFGDDCH